MIFAQCANSEGIDLMLKAGANQGVIDKNGRTALHYLVQADK